MTTRVTEQETLRITMALDGICNQIGEPAYTDEGENAYPTTIFNWHRPCVGVREITDDKTTAISLVFEPEDLFVIDWDYVCGSGEGTVFWKGTINDSMEDIIASILHGLNEAAWA